MNVAVILAGGTGCRFGGELPKQFLKIAEKTVLEHSVEIFEYDTLIDEIAIVIPHTYIKKVEEMILNNGWRKVKKILKGGNERYESSLTAIHTYKDNLNCNLIFHDAVRPLLSKNILHNVINALQHYNAVNVAIPVTDTIIKIDEDKNYIQSVPNRNYLMQSQTPQAFKLHTIKKAYDIGLQDKMFFATDDCGVVVTYLPEEKVYIVPGDKWNIKLTYKEDIFYLDKYLRI